MAYNSITNDAIRHLKDRVADIQTEEEFDTEVIERANGYVEGLNAAECRTICDDLGPKYSRAVDIGVLHRWGRQQDLSLDLDEFARSLASKLLQLAVRP